MPITIKKYNRQVEPETPNVPTPINPGAVRGAFGEDVYRANQQIGQAVSNIGEMLGKHAIEQKNLQDDAFVANQDIKHSMEVERMLNDPEKGYLNRMGLQSTGSLKDFDKTFNDYAQKEINSVRDQRLKAKISNNLMRTYQSAYGKVSSHEATQWRKGNIENLEAQRDLRISDPTGIPIERMGEIATLQNNINNANGFVGAKAQLEIQKSVGNYVNNVIDAGLQADPSGDTSREILEQVSGRMNKDDAVKLKKKIDTEVTKNAVDLLDNLNNKFIEGTITIEDIQSANKPREKGGIGSVSARKLLNDISRIQQDKIADITTNSDKAEAYINMVDSSILGNVDKYKAREILVSAFADNNFDREEIKKINRLKTILDKQKFDREDSGINNGFKILKGWFGSNDNDSRELAGAISNYMTYLDKGQSPEKASDKVLRQQYNKLYPQMPLSAEDKVNDPDRERQLVMSPAERFGRGFSQGVAGTVQGFGGALRWLGQEDLGKSVSNYAQYMKEFYAIPDPKFIDQVSAGFGSMATFFIPGAGITKGVQAVSFFPRLATWLGVGASTVLEATVESGNTYEQALQKGMSVKDAENSASKTFWVNIPTIAITNRLGVFGDNGSRIVKTIAASGFEGFQEFSQSVISNIALHDPAFKGAFESAVVGAIVGGGTKLSVEAGSTLKELAQAKETMVKFEEKEAEQTVNLKEEDSIKQFTDIQTTPQEAVDIQNQEATSVISYVKDGKKFYTKITPQELISLENEVKNIPKGNGEESQIHLDAITPNLTKNGTELNREEFVGGHSQVADVLKNASDYIGSSMVSFHKENIKPLVWNDINGLQSYKSDLENDSKFLSKDEEIVSAIKDVDKRISELSNNENKPKGGSLNKESGQLIIPNLPKVNPKVTKEIGQAGKDFGKFADSALVPLSTRLAKVHPMLRDALRKFEFGKGVSTHNDIQKAAPFLKHFSQIPEVDSQELDMALKNADKQAVQNIVDKHGIRQEYEQMRELLDEIYHRANESGIDISYLDEYFPRRVTDVDAFMTYLQNNENWSAISKSIKQEETKLGYRLNNEERAEFINKLLRGYGDSKIKIAKPSNLKQRKIQIIDENMNAFYQHSSETLQDYIIAMNNMIEAKKFFGFDGKNADESIGSYVDKLVQDGVISHSQEREVTNVIEARFKSKGMHGFWSFYRNLSFMATLNSPINTITQIQDLGFSLYENGFYHSMVGLNKAFSKNKITKHDLGVDIIIDEFSEKGKSGELLRKLFHAIGFSKVDSIGKETLINGTLSRMNNEANENNPELISELTRVFGDEAQQTLEDLKNNVASTNVKYILFSKLAKYQPIALSEMPEFYAKGGNGRIWYMLKSYTIKQIDVYHNEVLMQMKDNPLKATKNLMKLSMILALMGAGSDTIKNVLLGRPIILSDLVVDNILKLLGANKYSIYKARREGLGAAMWATILPPVPFLDDLFKDLTKKNKPDVSDMKIWNTLPVVGKLYYWWFGGGRENLDNQNGRKKSGQVHF